MSDGDETATLEVLGGDQALLTVSVAVAPPAHGRIDLELSIANTTDGPISISDPYDGTSYQLISESGAPLQVGSPPSRVKTHGRRDPAERLSYLEVRGATVGDSPVEPADLIHLDQVELAVSDQVVMSLTVARALDPADRTTPLESVPAGEYTLVVSLRCTVTLPQGSRHPLRMRTATPVPISVL